MIVKPLASEENLASANTVGAATVVRLVNTDTVAQKVTIKDASDNTVGSLTLVSGEVVHVQKLPEHTLSATVKVLAVKIAHTN